MCGIAGFYGDITIPRERIDECLSRMSRRGPDAKGVFRHESENGKKLVMLHSRLSIIDLDDRSNQPMRRDFGVLAFNGELYNYLELQKELIATNHNFHTDGDSEVLLALLNKSMHGMQSGCNSVEECLDTCEGMWAFAYYNRTSGDLFLSRDRFGEKPLYLYHADGGVYFGSEPKFLFALMGRTPALNRNHLSRYLVNGYKSLYKVRETFFEGLEELPAASVLRLGRDGSRDLQRYWTPAINPDESMTYDRAVREAKEALVNSVELRLRADVPIAFCMSGGIDSNALIGIARNVFDYDVHGFTITNSDKRYEEWDMVTAARDAYDIKHTPIPVQTGDFLPKLRTLVQQHDAPVYTITYYAHWLLMQSIAEHGYRISVSGTAADELFSGYFDHHLAYLEAVHRDPALHEQALGNWRQYIQPIVRNPYLQNPDRFVKEPDFRGHIYLDADEFAGYLTSDFSEPFFEECYDNTLLRNRMLNELCHESVPVILHEDDLNAMYYSIENRSPFLDRGLFDVCGKIPTRHLVQNGMAKAVLRDAVRGLVPDAVLDNHRKVGFNAPINSFLDVQDNNVREQILDDGPVFDFIKRDKVESLMAHDDLPNSKSKFLFYFLNTKMFMEEFA